MPLSKKHPFISRREWLRVAIFATALMTVTLGPYLIAWLTSGDNWVFNGFVFGVEDGNSYLGKMRLGVQGRWQFHIFFTPEPHDSVGLLYLPYMIPGQLIGLFIDAENPFTFSAMIIVFQLMRLIFGIVLIVVIYRFIAEFLGSPATRFVALILATMGGGFGWSLLLTGDLPPEFYIPEGFSLLILLGLPHIALGRAAMLMGFIALFRSLEQPRWAVLAGLLWLVVGLCVSFYLASIYCLMAAWGLMTWLHQRRFPIELTIRGTVAVGITLPLFGYYAVAFTQNDTFSTWSSQNELPSPNPLHYLLAYGVLATLAWIGGRWVWRRANDPRPLLLIGWVLVVPILVYLPINVQRRLLEGVLIPLVILGTIGLRLLILPLASHWKRPPRQVWKRLRLLALTTLTLSSVLFLLGMFVLVANPSQPMFRPSAEIQALDCLNKTAPIDSVVMGSFKTGNVIPARTNLRVFLGHDIETLQSDEKEELVEAFYHNETEPDFYQKFGIDYVVYGPLEREINLDWIPPETDTICSEKEYQIYKVMR